MDAALYLVVLALIKGLQALPLTWVARLGRAGGALAYWIDARHRRVATQNLALSLGQPATAPAIRDLARENFRRLGETYCCAIKTAAMDWNELKHHLEFVGTEKIVPVERGQPPPSFVMAIGHFGNFELYARFREFVPEFQCATTYRGLRQPSLNRLMQSLRSRSGCVYFERRTESAALRAWMQPTGRMLGFLADQHAAGGIRVPFFGRECSTTVSPAVFALRYHCVLHTGICFRVGLARWRIEVGDCIPTQIEGKARRVEDITRDINKALEEAIRRDPANWFWVHNRWKPDKSARPPAAASGQPQTGPAGAPASTNTPGNVTARGLAENDVKQ
jgi:KDO2-lipid IV(A) lauroyltransferase